MIRKRFVFSGRVQGVGFRYLTRRAAILTGITGWVRNERDGSVTLEVQGTGEQIDETFMALVSERKLSRSCLMKAVSAQGTKVWA